PRPEEAHLQTDEVEVEPAAKRQTGALARRGTQEHDDPGAPPRGTAPRIHVRGRDHLREAGEQLHEHDGVIRGPSRTSLDRPAPSRRSRKLSRRSRLTARSGPSGQEKLAVPGDHRAATILLPGDHPDVRDAPAELEDLRARTCGRRARRAEVVDAERDRLRDTVAAALLEQVKQGRELEEGAE